ncbi:MAG TPA: J domain-containing protein [Thermoanaerobaculia bacterium]|jgi:curved DNA-binding protein CbpA|nr:J domain-containing protein [Thermoanaerobaculia bacterium]
METPYSVLGLPAAATAEEIARAYRKLVRRYPPELAPQQFARIHHAYQLLTSPERRMEVARTAPEETIDQLFPVPTAILRAPASPPPVLTGLDLEPLLAPFRRVRLLRILREAFADGRGSAE